MAVNVDQLTTEVIPEPEPSEAGAPPPSGPWEIVEQTRAAYSRWMRDHRRTSAEGFDD